jgi:hypothetical protein
VLASAAAGSVLEIGDDVHRLGGLCSSILRTFLLLPFLLSGRDPLADRSLCSGSYGPDEAQQFTSNCSGDLSLIFACCSQSHVTLVQPVLCFPRNLFDLF